MVKEYITDEKANIKSVVLDYVFYQQIESVIEDFLLGKIIAETENDVDISLEDTKLLISK